ncbi:papain-like cysteine protease family protein [Bradyrhizobium sp. USDA 3458]|uniref:papain-like cysteine protease family protein n=1 Tax=Bradyrhizobium sp. USDA 3458 TaxID=2591461 RepID=UPI0024C0B474|nr:papain-like cysteine protease family protein [Bradyrhizobium sp. USDA 3458]
MRGVRTCSRAPGIAAAARAAGAVLGFVGTCHLACALAICIALQTVVLQSVPAIAAARDAAASAASLRPPDATTKSRLGLKDWPIRIRLEVPAIRQPTPMSCWATVYTMMRSWKLGRPVSIDAAISELGAPFTKYLSDDGGLPGGQELEFVKAAGLRAKPPASYPLTIFRKLLRENGPVWIVTGDGITSHARLLVGIYGTDEAEKIETYKSSVMEFIDPASGKYVYEPALKFFAVFEREAAFIVDNRYDALDLRWQIISY